VSGDVFEAVAQAIKAPVVLVDAAFESLLPFFESLLLFFESLLPFFEGFESDVGVLGHDVDGLQR